ncbi:MAG: CTP:molybdopterin cytidylyltransferase MocA [Bacteroidia bacterium]|jgi:CTP:molybdopterin cytidylyltransferase MocA
MQLDPDTHQMTAIVLAGDRTKSDSLIHHTEAGSKAMIDLDGMPMVRRVLNSLRASRVVGPINLAGPEASELAKDSRIKGWIEDGEIAWSEPGSSPSTSAYNAMKGLAPDVSVLLTTADHPLLTPEIVDAFGRQSLADNVDLTVGLAPYALIEETYPGIKKTVLRFSDGEFCGCNLFGFITPEGRRAARFWRKIEQERKKPMVVIGLLGWWAVIRYRLGLLSLEEALAKLSKRLGLRIRAVILPYANAAIDVDSIADLVLVKGALEKAAAEGA